MPPQNDEALTVRAIRFYSPASGTTTIEGVGEVRLPALTQGVGQVSRYRVDLAVLDSAGLELNRQDWTRDVPASLAHARGATMLESFSFPAGPGRYRVRLRVTPSAGLSVEREVTVAAWGSVPAISDLVVASQVREPGADSVLAPGEIRRGNLVLRSGPTPRLTPTETQLSWYAELYPRSAAAAQGQLEASVMAADGRPIVRTAPRPISIPATGGSTAGSLDLAGLPEGRYKLRLSLRLGDSTLLVEAPFAMAPVSAPVAASSGPAPAAFFASADSARLDSLFGPLVYVADAQRDNLGVYRTLTVDGRRRFLEQFWTRRDPTPGTPDNPARDEFYRAVDYVNQAFREGGTADIPGWNTDRGRIYLKYGRPSQTLPRPAASPKPFEAWQFTRDRNLWYVFQDQTGVGHYILIGTNDRREAGRQGWQRILGPDGTRDVYQFLNLDLRELRELNNNP